MTINHEGQLKGVSSPKGPRYRDVIKAYDPCVYCGRFAEGELQTYDHVVPLSKDGPNRADNKVIACRECNHRKGSRKLLEFLVTERHRRTRQLVVGCRCRSCKDQRKRAVTLQQIQKTYDAVREVYFEPSYQKRRRAK